MDFFDKDPRVYIEPSEEIEFYRAAYPLPSKLIYSPFSRSELSQKSGKRKMKELPKLYPGTHLYCIDDKVLLFQGFIGAPATVVFLEQLIALGIREFVFLGLAGAIQTAKIGDQIIVTEAVRLEGTSHHYLPVNTPSIPSEKIFNDLVDFFNSRGITVTKGTICSTDAPFRETFNLINKLRQKKVIAIEMEIAAAFAVATFRKVNAAALVIISDELKENQWSRFQPGNFSKAFLSSFNHLIDFFS